MRDEGKTHNKNVPIFEPPSTQPYTDTDWRTEKDMTYTQFAIASQLAVARSAHFLRMSSALHLG